MRLIRSNFKVAVGANTAISLGAVAGVLSPRVTTTLRNGTTLGVLIRSLASNRAPSPEIRSGPPPRREDAAIARAACRAKSGPWTSRRDGCGRLDEFLL